MRQQYSILFMIICFAGMLVSACTPLAKAVTPSSIQGVAVKSSKPSPHDQHEATPNASAQSQSSPIAQFEKWVGNGAIIISLCSAAFSGLSFNSSRLRNELDVQVKMLEQYWKVMEKRATAFSKRELPAWRDFYRSYCDLLWMEYYLWDKGVLGDKLFFTWLSYARDTYRESFEYDENGNNQKKTFEDIWAELTSGTTGKYSYFDPKDDFVVFMKMVFAPENKEKPLKDIPGVTKKRSLRRRLGIAA